MTNVSNAVPALGELNRHSFDDPRVHLTNGDAFVWLDNTQTEPFDIAIVDFPDPNNFALGKLYTTRFYNLLKVETETGLVGRYPNNIAADRTQIFLVHRQDARGRRFYRQTVSDDGSELWHLGIRPGKTPAIRHANETARPESNSIF